MSWTDAIGGSFSGAREVAASLAALLAPPSIRRSTRVYTASPAVPLDSVNTPAHMGTQDLRGSAPSINHEVQRMLRM